MASPDAYDQQQQPQPTFDPTEQAISSKHRSSLDLEAPTPVTAASNTAHSVPLPPSPSPSPSPSPPPDESLSTSKRNNGRVVSARGEASSRLPSRPAPPLRSTPIRRSLSNKSAADIPPPFILPLGGGPQSPTPTRSFTLPIAKRRRKKIELIGGQNDSAPEEGEEAAQTKTGELEDVTALTLEMEGRRYAYQGPDELLKKVFQKFDINKIGSIRSRDFISLCEELENTVPGGKSGKIILDPEWRQLIEGFANSEDTTMELDEVKDLYFRLSNVSLPDKIKEINDEYELEADENRRERAEMKNSMVFEELEYPSEVPEGQSTPEPRGRRSDQSQGNAPYYAGEGLSPSPSARAQRPISPRRQMSPRYESPLKLPQRSPEEVANLIQQNRELVDEIEQLRENVKTLEGQMTKHVISSEQTINGLETTLQQTQKENAEKTARIEEIKKRYDEAKASEKKTREQLEKAELDRQKLVEEKDALTAEIKKEREIRIGFERKAERLTTDIRLLTEARDKANHDYENVRGKVSKVSTEHNDLVREKSEAQAKVVKVEEELAQAQAREIEHRHIMKKIIDDLSGAATGASSRGSGVRQPPKETLAAILEVGQQSDSSAIYQGPPRPWGSGIGDNLDRHIGDFAMIERAAIMKDGEAQTEIEAPPFMRDTETLQELPNWVEYWDNPDAAWFAYLRIRFPEQYNHADQAGAAIVRAAEEALLAEATVTETGVQTSPVASPTRKRVSNPLAEKAAAEKPTASTQTTPPVSPPKYKPPPRSVMSSQGTRTSPVTDQPTESESDDSSPPKDKGKGRAPEEPEPEPDNGIELKPSIRPLTGGHLRDPSHVTTASTAETNLTSIFSRGTQETPASPAYTDPAPKPTIRQTTIRQSQLQPRPELHLEPEFQPEPEPELPQLPADPTNYVGRDLGARFEERIICDLRSRFFLEKLLAKPHLDTGDTQWLDRFVQMNSTSPDRFMLRALYALAPRAASASVAAAATQLATKMPNRMVWLTQMAPPIPSPLGALNYPLRQIWGLFNNLTRAEIQAQAQMQVAAAMSPVPIIPVPNPTQSPSPRKRRARTTATDTAPAPGNPRSTPAYNPPSAPTPMTPLDAITRSRLIARLPTSESAWGILSAFIFLVMLGLAAYNVWLHNMMMADRSEWLLANGMVEGHMGWQTGGTGCYMRCDDGRGWRWRAAVAEWLEMLTGMEGWERASV